jgi:hypothetical protein
VAQQVWADAVFIFPGGVGGKEAAMRRMPVILGSSMLALLVNATPSKAQEFRHYPFCLFTGGSESSIELCAFDTFEQCLLTRSGGGGICFANPWYWATGEQPRQKPRRRRG